MISNLTQLKERLQIPDDWDLLLVGDGSGLSWDCPGGWCGIMLERFWDGVKYHPLFVGGSNRGSINWLEIMPYWIMVRHHYHQGGGRKRSHMETFIVSDSQWAVEAMQGRYLLKSHQDMRLLFKFYRDRGYNFYWKHLPREELSLNSLADKMASVGREYMSFADAPRPEGVFHCEEQRIGAVEPAPQHASPAHSPGDGLRQLQGPGGAAPQQPAASAGPEPLA